MVQLNLDVSYKYVMDFKIYLFPYSFWVWNLGKGNLETDYKDEITLFSFLVHYYIYCFYILSQGMAPGPSPTTSLEVTLAAGESSWAKN